MHLQQILFSLNPDNIILCGSGKIKFGANRDGKQTLSKLYENLDRQNLLRDVDQRESLLILCHHLFEVQCSTCFCSTPN